MNVRKLRKEEHIKTKPLWEEVFTEDTSQFLDYYYSVKTLQNEIYVIEDKGQIVSMLHLNPFQMRIGPQVYETHYIVAVATAPLYRRQGLMARLLEHVFQVMEERGEPFTFLMPASESIYTPFGFEFVYEQPRANLSGKAEASNNVTYVYATSKDCAKIADFANKQLQTYDITTWRTAAYYEMVLAEQISENGGILLAKEGEQIKGVFCFAKEDHLEIREPIFVEESFLLGAIFHLTGNETEEVTCIGYGTETKPMIMAKVLQPEFKDCFKQSKVFLNELV